MNPIPLLFIGIASITCLALVLSCVLHEKEKLSKEQAAYEKKKKIEAMRNLYKRLEPKQ